VTTNVDAHEISFNVRTAGMTLSKPSLMLRTPDTIALH
jgi:hypothetical protein